MNVLKKEEGITLMVMVITVVILAILFAVTIEELTGNSGFITQIKSTAERENVEIDSNQRKIDHLKEGMQDQENDGVNSIPIENNINLAISNTQDKQCTVKLNIPTFKDNITKIEYRIAKQDQSYSNWMQYSQNPISLEYTFYEMELEEDYKIQAKLTYLDETEQEGELLSNEITVRVYDPIQRYGNLVNGYIAKGHPEDTWKLLYCDDDYAYLIADIPKYHNSSSNYHQQQDGTSIGVIGRRLNPTFETEVGFSEKQNGYAISGIEYLTNTSQWEDYLDEDGNALYAIGSPTFELFANSYNHLTSNTIIPIAVNSDEPVEEEEVWKQNCGYVLNTEMQLEKDGILTMYAGNTLLASPRYTESNGSTDGILRTYVSSNRLFLSYTTIYNYTSFYYRPVVCMPRNKIYGYELTAE